jgi:hypothetical protein
VSWQLEGESVCLDRSMDLSHMSHHTRDRKRNIQNIIGLRTKTKKPWSKSLDSLKFFNLSSCPSNLEVIFQSSIEAVEIISTPISTPGNKEIVIKVIISGKPERLQIPSITPVPSSRSYLHSPQEKPSSQ